MSYQTHDPGFAGTSNELNALRAAVNGVLVAIDALANDQPSTSPATVRTYLSTANLAGTPESPVVDLRWVTEPPTPSLAVGVNLVVEAALRASIAGVTVRHNSKTAYFGAIDVPALGAALGF